MNQQSALQVKVTAWERRPPCAGPGDRGRLRHICVAARSAAGMRSRSMVLKLQSRRSEWWTRAEAAAQAGDLAQDAGPAAQLTGLPTVGHCAPASPS